MSDKSKNIYQRIIEVQKAVKTVAKNETIKMHENDKGYKAVTHDDVAALLHEPLANAGIVMLPDVTKYNFSSFEFTDKWKNLKTWYRCDIEILVKWINADDPKDFIESKSAAFAMDSSDKCFAKAYSLALKICLLKVHLLESRDNEEKRDLEAQLPDGDNGQNKGKGKAQPQGNKNKNQSKAAPIDHAPFPGEENSKPKTPTPLDTFYKLVKEVGMSADQASEFIKFHIGSDIKSNKLSTIELEKLNSELIALKNSENKTPDETKIPNSDDYVVPCGEYIGCILESLAVEDLKKVLMESQKNMTQVPPLPNVGEWMQLTSKVKKQLKDLGAWPLNAAPGGDKNAR